MPTHNDVYAYSTGISQAILSDLHRLSLFAKTYKFSKILAKINTPMFELIRCNYTRQE